MSDDVMREEHNRLKAEARANRRAFFKSEDSAFVKEMKQAQKSYVQMRSEGVSLDDACRGLEAVLRGAWPKPATKFPAQCEACEDGGWRFRTCADQMRCGRMWCANQHPASEHTYVEPCGCVAGDRHQKRIAQVDDEIAAAGRMAKRKTRGWSAVGR